MNKQDYSCLCLPTTLNPIKSKGEEETEGHIFYFCASELYYLNKVMRIWSPEVQKTPW